MYWITLLLIVYICDKNSLQNFLYSYSFLNRYFSPFVSTSHSLNVLIFTYFGLILYRYTYLHINPHTHGCTPSIILQNQTQIFTRESQIKVFHTFKIVHADIQALHSISFRSHSFELICSSQLVITGKRFLTL